MSVSHPCNCVELKNELMAALVDACPNSTKDGGFIRRGYNAQLDEYRNLAAGGKQWIAKYQQRVIDETGISNLKIGYNKVFGYYLETTNAHRDKLPSHTDIEWKCVIADEKTFAIVQWQNGIPVTVYPARDAVSKPIWPKR